MSPHTSLSHTAISLLVDRLAKIYRWQGRRKALLRAKGQVYGLNNYESTKKVEQLSLFGKMSQELFATDLEKFSGAFPKAGTMRNGKLSAQPLSDTIIYESGSSLLPTQMAYSGKRRPGQTKLEVKLRKLKPTPCATDYKGRTGRNYKDPKHIERIDDLLMLPKGQVLNPCRGEYRMGLPIGWTDLQP
jgi:hypothetical protein